MCGFVHFCNILNAFLRKIGHNKCTRAVYGRVAMLHMFVEFQHASLTEFFENNNTFGSRCLAVPSVIHKEVYDDGAERTLSIAANL